MNAQRALRSIRGVPVAGKRVLLRIDGNVAVDDDGKPAPGGEQRLEALVPTVRHLRENGARLILLTHLGRPGGQAVDQLRLEGVARRLSVLLQAPVRYVSDLRGPQARAAVDSLFDGDLLLLENLRFDPGEEACDPRFATDLAALGDIVVNDAFGVSHRRHASVALLPTLRPSYAGLLLEQEVTVLRRLLEQPEHPIVGVVGGVKLETKLGLLKNLLPRVDRLLTGGGIANTLLAVSGLSTGVSLIDRHATDEVQNLVLAYREKVVLPFDVRVVRAGDVARPILLLARSIGPADEICDLGPETSALYCRLLHDARTVIWNGPLGKFELPVFAEATRAVATCVPTTSFAVVGGGDTVRALTELNLVHRFDHVSTGGGAMLAFLEGSPMPGIEPLYDS